MPELVCAADDPRWLAERRKGVTATAITGPLLTVAIDDWDWLRDRIAEQAEENIPRTAIIASTSDIPRSCICAWRWQSWRWQRIQTYLACPWHGRG